MNSLEMGEIMEYARTGPPYSETTHKVDLTDEQRYVSPRSKEVYEIEIKRYKPWIIKNDTLYRFKIPQKLFALSNIPAEDLASISVETISWAEIAQEKDKVPAEVKESILTFKRIEDKLNDFMKNATNGFRNYWGIANSYNQWGGEENEHSNAEAMILKALGYMTQQQLNNDYLENSQRTWEQPHETPRQMVIYAYFQELLTKWNYLNLSKTAKKHGADKTARVLEIISKDEGYHSEGYHKFINLFHEFDPEGTIRDICYVALNFRMPAQHLMRDQVKDGMNIMKARAFSKSMVSEETLYRGMKNLRIVPEELCREVADSYWDHFKETTPIYSKSREDSAQMLVEIRKENALFLPDGTRASQNGNGEHSGLIVPSSGDLFVPGKE